MASARALTTSDQLRTVSVSVYSMGTVRESQFFMFIMVLDVHSLSEMESMREGQ